MRRSTHGSTGKLTAENQTVTPARGRPKRQTAGWLAGWPAAVRVRGGWGRIVSICRACCRQLVAQTPLATAHATPRSARAHRGALALEQAGTSRRELLPVLRATRVMMGVLSSVPRRSGRGALAAADCPRPRSCQSGRRKVRHAAQAANQHKLTEGPLVPSPA